MENSQLEGHINDTLGISRHLFLIAAILVELQNEPLSFFHSTTSSFLSGKVMGSHGAFLMMSAPGKSSPVSGCSYSSHSCRSKVNNCSSITDNIMYTNILVRTNDHFYSRLKISGWTASFANFFEICGLYRWCWWRRWIRLATVRTSANDGYIIFCGYIQLEVQEWWKEWRNQWMHAKIDDLLKAAAISCNILQIPLSGCRIFIGPLVETLR